MGRNADSLFSLLSGKVLGPGAAWAAKGVRGSQNWQTITSPVDGGHPALDKITKGYTLLFK
jgi:hypothetical protein